MSIRTDYNFNLPVTGSYGGWGDAINKNFLFVDKELRKLHESVASTRQLIGANVPYVHIDENNYFVKLELQTNILILKYYANSYLVSDIIHGAIDDNNSSVYEFNIETSSWKNNKTPDLFLAAYVVNEETVILGGTLPEFQQGDILVIVQQLGTIYGSNSAPITLKKYLPASNIYCPVLTTEQPYKLKFNKLNYAAAYDLDNKEFILPSIGLGTFNVLRYSKDICTINGEETTVGIEYDSNAATLTWNIVTAVGDNDIVQLLPHCNFSIEDEEYSRSIIYISHKIHVEFDEHERVARLWIIIDTSGLSFANETLCCEVFMTHRGWSTT